MCVLCTKSPLEHRSEQIYKPTHLRPLGVGSVHRRFGLDLRRAALLDDGPGLKTPGPPKQSRAAHTHILHYSINTLE